MTREQRLDRPELEKEIKRLVMPLSKMRAISMTKDMSADRELIADNIANELTAQLVALIPDEKETKDALIRLNRGKAGIEPDEKEIRERERERIDSIQGKAIEVIEELTCRDEFGMSDTLECKLLTKIYTLAHIARGRCENRHEDWLEELENIWQALQQGENK